MDRDQGVSMCGRLGIARARGAGQNAPRHENRRRGMTLTKLGATASAIALLALAGCDRVGNPFDVLAVKRPAPDEFQVITREPLRMPASVSLPEPRPGAPSPLDPNPGRDAAVALLGAPARPVVATPGSGEQALLAAADAAASDPEIRTILAAEREAGSGEYEPPTIWELFGASSGPDVDPAEIIDAAAEARRLQTEGVAAAPIDPNDIPEGEEPAEPPSSYPAVAVDRRPQNKLPSSGATPAF
jgi:hypothetical protein